MAVLFLYSNMKKLSRWGEKNHPVLSFYLMSDKKLSYSVVENTGVLTFLIFYGPHIIIGEICLFEAMVCALMGPCVCFSDVNECLGSSVCPGQMCLNTQGSYTCRSCQTGFQPSEDGHTCQGVIWLLTCLENCPQTYCCKFWSSR